MTIKNPGKKLAFKQVTERPVTNIMQKPYKMYECKQKLA